MKPFTWLVGGPKLTFITNLTQEEFTARFNESVGKPVFNPLGGHRGATKILGKFHSEGHFKLLERKVTRDSALPYFHGHIKPSTQGTKIIGSFSSSPVNIVTISLILFLAFMFSTALCLNETLSLIEGKEASPLIMLSTAMATIGIIVTAIFASVTTKKTEQKYIDFFNSIFEAKLIDREQ